MRQSLYINAYLFGKRLWHLLKLGINLEKYGPIRTTIKLVGVTGTDGKTTTASYIYQILNSARIEVGMVSTLGVCCGNKMEETGPHTTTPTYREIKHYLSTMEEAGIKYAVIEATAHGLFQYRLFGLHFAVSALTNITHEHLDYFYTLKNYTRAKQLLFDHSDKAVVNADDFQSSAISHNRKVTYGRSADVDYQIVNEAHNQQGSTFDLKHDGTFTQVKIQLPGDYNILNATAAAVTCRELGIAWDSVQDGLQKLTSVTGRFSAVALPGCNFTVVVDFAHTPNALERILSASKETLKPHRLLSVFGCAGLRDKKKRPLMGRVAAENADIVYLTAEDPRTENFTQIVNQVIAGIPQSLADKCKIYPDRYQAIKTALSNAQEGDLVLITGKGHETTMCFGKEERPWNDTEAVLACWKELKG